MLQAVDDESPTTSSNWQSLPEQRLHLRNLRTRAVNIWHWRRVPHWLRALAPRYWSAHTSYPSCCGHAEAIQRSGCLYGIGILQPEEQTAYVSTPPTELLSGWGHVGHRSPSSRALIRPLSLSSSLPCPPPHCLRLFLSSTSVFADEPQAWFGLGSSRQ